MTCHRERRPLGFSVPWVKVDPADSHASYRSYPTTKSQLRAAIETAFVARTTKPDNVDNSRAFEKVQQRVLSHVDR